MALAVIAAGPAAQPPSADDSLRSCVFLLKQAAAAQGGSRSGQLLRSLRSLKDPGLKPYFEVLAASADRRLQVHGLLGLAEIERRVDLGRLAAIKDPATLAQLLGAAMDAEILSDEQAQQLMAWQDLDDSVKLVVATQLVANKKLSEPAALLRMLEAPRLAQRGLAAMLLAQTGSPQGLAELGKVDTAADRTRDEVRTMLLQTAIRMKYDSVGPWAVAVASDQRASANLRTLALQAAMQFGQMAGRTIWSQWLASEKDAAQRLRLAILGLQSAPWLKPGDFDGLATDADALFAEIGATGRLVAGGEDPTAAISALVRRGHVLVNEWALGYAREHATPPQAEAIHQALIEALDGPAHGQEGRLEQAVVAVQELYEGQPATAAKLLRAILQDEKRSVMLQRAVLLGLLRTKQPAANAVLEGVQLTDPMSRGLALLVAAKAGQRMSAAQLEELSLIVRGAGPFEDSLRIQAGWLYTKQTGQVKTVLAAVVGGQSQRSVKR